MIDYKTYPKVEDYVMLSNSWPIKWGLYLIFGLLLVVMVFASLIPYNTIIDADVTITSKEPIVFIKSRSVGHLINGTIKPGDIIDKNDFLGFISNEGDYHSIINLEVTLNCDSLDLNDQGTFTLLFSPREKLGLQLMDKYANFIKSYSSYISLKKTKNRESIEDKLDNVIDGNIKNITSKRKELKNSRSVDLSAQKIFVRQRELFDKGIISKQELEEHEKDYYENIRISENVQSEMNRLNSDLAITETEKTLVLHEYSESILKAFMELKVAKQLLLSGIDNWKQNNILSSPVSGKISFYNFDNKYRNTEIGDTIYAILPTKNNNLIGKLKIPPHNSNKVHHNQKVIINLENYPAVEWGSLNGRVSAISRTLNYQGKIGFTTIIEIDSTTTNYGKNIVITQDMMGKAHIILDETSILQRIFYRFKSIWLNNK
jgi:hypothetical protein